MKKIKNIQKRSTTIRRIKNGEKICDCPQCGAEIQHGLSDDTIEIFKNSKFFEPTFTENDLIDFVNYYIDLHTLDFRYKLENRTIIHDWVQNHRK